MSILLTQLLAQSIENPVLDNISGLTPSQYFGGLIPLIISLIIVVGIVAFLVFLLMGGVAWITSGGDKMKLEQARKRLTAAFIGLIILLSFIAIARLFETFFGVGFGQIHVGRFYIGTEPLPTIPPSTPGPTAVPGTPTLPPGTTATPGPTLPPGTTATPTSPPVTVSPGDCVCIDWEPVSIEITCPPDSGVVCITETACACLIIRPTLPPITPGPTLPPITPGPTTPPTPTSSFCSDTDGGINVYSRGTVSGTGPSCTSGMTDYCTSGSTLVEYYCQNNDCTSTTVYCNGCISGVCPPLP